MSGLTALNSKEQNFDLMYEQLKALKEGKTVAKPIYNHVNGYVHRLLAARHRVIATIAEQSPSTWNRASQGGGGIAVPYSRRFDSEAFLALSGVANVGACGDWQHARHPRGD
jgi:hypothetical protein